MMKLTGVSLPLAAAHEREGVVHGHTWVIRAWRHYDGMCATKFKEELRAVVSELDHSLLPVELSDGEDLAHWIGSRLKGCIAVDAHRPTEGFYARWEL